METNYKTKFWNRMCLLLSGLTLVTYNEEKGLNLNEYNKPGQEIRIDTNYDTHKYNNIEYCLRNQSIKDLYS